MERLRMQRRRIPDVRVPLPEISTEESVERPASPTQGEFVMQRSLKLQNILRPLEGVVVDDEPNTAVAYSKLFHDLEKAKGQSSEQAQELVQQFTEPFAAPQPGKPELSAQAELRQLHIRETAANRAELRANRAQVFSRMANLFSTDKEAKAKAKESLLGFHVLLGGKTEYVLEKSIGQGGFGAAFLAEDVSHDHRTCVAKFSAPLDRKTMFMHPDADFQKLSPDQQSESLTSAIVSRALINEVAALHQLKKLGEYNPAPLLYDAESIPDPRDNDRRIMAVTMERAPGVPMNKFTWDGTQQTDEVMVELFAQIAEDLSLAHSVGVAHGDIKPSNIMVDVRPVAGADEPTLAVGVKIIDWGSALVSRLVAKQANANAIKQPEGKPQQAVYAQPVTYKRVVEQQPQQMDTTQVKKDWMTVLKSRLGVVAASESAAVVKTTHEEVVPLPLYTKGYALESEPVSPQRDAYSLGKTMLRILIGQDFADEEVIPQRIAALESSRQKELAAVALQLTENTPTKRISAQQASDLLRDIQMRPAGQDDLRSIEDPEALEEIVVDIENEGGVEDVSDVRSNSQ